MGFTVGTFHVECKYTSKNGPQLIEVLRTASLPLAFCQELSVDLSETVHFVSAYQCDICIKVEQSWAGVNIEHPLEELCIFARHVCIST